MRQFHLPFAKAIVGCESWATCPIVENGVIRILSEPYCPNSPGTPAVKSKLLFNMRELSGDHFWPDDISILDGALIDVQKLRTPGQITDSYLLALAQSHGGFLATFGQRLSVSAVKGGKEALHIIADYAR